MNDSFEKKVRAAAVAGWWTILIAVAFITLQWIIYLAVMATHPAWLLAMWGRTLLFRLLGRDNFGRNRRGWICPRRDNRFRLYDLLASRRLLRVARQKN